MSFAIKAVILDWAGTMIDHGSRAPVVALRHVFADAGVTISEAEARADMGRAKRDHIRAILAMPRVTAAWRALHGADPDEETVSALHDAVEPMMRVAAKECATLIPGAADLVVRLTAAQVRIASCTGYTRSMMADILPLAAAQGYAPEVVVCSGETLEGRPSPLMLWKALVDLGVWPASACVKVDDATVGIGEGRAGGRLDGRSRRIGQRRRARSGRAAGAFRRGATAAYRDLGRRTARGGRGLCRRQRRRSLAGTRDNRRADRRRRDAAAMRPPAPRPEGAVTRWLRAAPPALFALYGGLAAFSAYFAMYAYRKPFSAGHYEHAAGWPFAIDFKIVLVIAQVAGYAVSKIVGVKIVSEMPPSRRAAAILLLIGLSELALAGFAIAPPLLGVAALFVNGLMLGMIWGLVFGFLEGRRLTEILGAILCASFILSSGIVKSAGEAVLVAGWASERWMPATTGLLFAPLLLVSVWALAQLPPPDARDEAERAPRTPMRAAQRRALFARHAPALVALIGTYVLLTALRDFRDNFAAEIWGELGYGGEASIFTWSEIPVAAISLVALAMLIRVRDNVHAVLWNLGLIAAGLATLGVATALFQFGLLGPIAWMIAVGAGLYLAYTPFNALLFDRLIAATGSPGNAGFLIYVADASGYVGSVVLLLVRSFAHLSLRWSLFLCDVAYATALIGLVATAFAMARLNASLRLENPPAVAGLRIAAAT